MTKDEALKLALEALELSNANHWWGSSSIEKAITAIKEALAQPEQKPVAWMYEVNNAHTCLDLFEPPDDAYDEGTLHPLYTTSPQRTWVGLTDEEREEIALEVPMDAVLITEAKLKEKNVPKN